MGISDTLDVPCDYSAASAHAAQFIRYACYADGRRMSGIPSPSLEKDAQREFEKAAFALGFDLVRRRPFSARGAA